MWLLYERNCKICTIVETVAIEFLELFDPIGGYCVEKKFNFSVYYLAIKIFFCFSILLGY